MNCQCPWRRGSTPIWLILFSSLLYPLVKKAGGANAGQGDYLGKSLWGKRMVTRYTIESELKCTFCGSRHVGRLGRYQAAGNRLCHLRQARFFPYEYDTIDDVVTRLPYFIEEVYKS